MALFGLFGKKSESSPHKKHAERVANKRAQAVDRWDSIQALVQVGTEESIEALLPRFTFYVDPSITDQEEKDAAFEGIVGCGELAIPPAARFLARAESIAWPLKILTRVAPQDVVVGHLLELLGRMDTEYERDPQRKIDMIAALEERQDGRIVEAVQRFLDDANETVRFNAVGALLAQQDAERALPAFLRCLATEDSVRVRNRILERLASAEWSVPEDQRPAVDGKLTQGYRMDKAGRIQRG